MRQIKFDPADLVDARPPPGWHAARVTQARYSASSNGNRMIQVLYGLLEPSLEHARLAEYFVLAGVSPHGVAMARRRLVALYRAAGRAPKAGEAIAPSELLGAELEIELQPETWQGQERLRVAGHRPRRVAAAPGARL
jgi:hypothetical protein